MNTTQLRELAKAIKGWKLRDVLQTPDDKDEGVAFVGHQSDVGIFDDIVHIDNGNYMQPQAAIQIANYYAAANPAAILALLDRIKELEDELRACVGSLDYVERTFPMHAGYGVRQHRIETARTLLEKSK